uniref:Uncharacterized protein n=1 Tax=Anguilla anguilla TaxID=7936 RepID=A0A0E9QK66_ANGAN
MTSQPGLSQDGCALVLVAAKKQNLVRFSSKYESNSDLNAGQYLF